MADSTPKIVVAGDVSIDWLAFSVSACDAVETDGRMPHNWQLQTGTSMFEYPGGALLLSRMVSLATGTQVISHQISEPEKIPPDKIIHSLVELDRFPLSSDKKDAKKLVYRVKRLCGFSGPVQGTTKPLAVNNDDPYADIIVLDDAGNGFRDSEEVWPAALRTEGHQPVVIYKMSRPLCRGKLWDGVHLTHAEKLVVVIRANDLRAESVNISRRLSWERTAKDFIWQMASNSQLISLANCSNLIVTFGLDGAIHYTKKEGRLESRLYYDPSMVEDGFRDICPGDMLGFTSAFVAAVTARIAEEGLAATGEGVRDGLQSARRLFRKGFGTALPSHHKHGVELFNPASPEDQFIADVIIPISTAPEPADPDFWCILKDVNGPPLEELAYQIVLQGETIALKDVPVGRFGKLKTVDRAEIESFRSIRNLIIEYMKGDSNRPLSIAVFGPPGSGKSFGVTEVAESIAPGRIERREFNLAQFTSISDLTSAMHKVRDIALSGRIPLIFFDEFDSAYNGNLGWLKYFLAPMQDGAFKDGESMHPTGRAIFVFAGGTSKSYEEFYCQGCKDRKRREFEAAKGPDFVSRLRGYVNILGPNQVNPNDNFWIIRRALLLRSFLERKAKHLLDNTGNVQMDPGVLRAFLKVSKYEHGSRSMEAIIDMSLISDRRSYEQAALPPAAQLKLHVDAEDFSRHVFRDVLLGSAREIIARAIHEKYRSDQKDNKPSDDFAMRPWDKLGEDFKQSNLRQADHIPEKLRRIGCSFYQAVGRIPLEFKFTDSEVEIMAEMEHDRWVIERKQAGWRLGPKRDEKQKTSPHLVSWKDLPQEVKKWDRDAVLGIPKFLADLGFEIYRHN